MFKLSSYVPIFMLVELNIFRKIVNKLAHNLKLINLIDTSFYYNIVIPNSSS